MTQTQTPENNQVEPSQIDPRDYKIAALRERISTIVAQYEDSDADKRVEITFLLMQKEQLEARVKELEFKLEDNENQTEEKSKSVRNK